MGTTAYFTGGVTSILYFISLCGSLSEFRVNNCIVAVADASAIQGAHAIPSQRLPNNHGVAAPVAPSNNVM